MIIWKKNLLSCNFSNKNMFESFRGFNPIEKIRELKNKKLPYDYEDFSDTEIKDEEGNLSTYYYGTNTKKESNNFRPDKYGVIFVTPSHEFSKRFASNWHVHADYNKGRIISVNVNVKKVFDFKKREHIMDVMPLIREKISKEKISDFKKESILKGISVGSYSGFRNKKVIEALKEKGYDGYYEFEDFDSNTKSLAVFYREQIKELGTEKISREILDKELGYEELHKLRKMYDSHKKNNI